MSGTVDLSKALGWTAEPQAVAWNTRDLLLYAVGIGAARDDLDFIYEKSKGFSPFPTYPLVLGLKGATEELQDFDKMRDSGGKSPYLPKLPSDKLVHAEQSIEIVKPIPLVGKVEDGWKLTRKLTGIHEKGKNIIIEFSSTLTDGTGTVYAILSGSTFFFGASTGQGFSKSIETGSQLLKGVSPKSKPPTREADFTFVSKTSPEQAILYRLSGDFNPLHVDPKIGKGMGFKGPILHGLCSYGHAAMALAKTVCEKDSQRLKAMGARFTSPVYPGDTLETLVWAEDKGDVIHVDFIQRIKETGKVCIGGGVAIISKASTKSKL